MFAPRQKKKPFCETNDDNDHNPMQKDSFFQQFDEGSCTAHVMNISFALAVNVAHNWANFFFKLFADAFFPSAEKQKLFIFI